MTGEKQHVTSKHVRGKGRPTKDSPPPEAEPVVAALAVANGVAEGTPYHGGGLHLHGGLFMAQVSEHTEPSDTNSPLPVTTSILCHDDFFHVSEQGESHESTPQSESSSGQPTGSLCLLTEKAPAAQPNYHRTSNIYALSSSSGPGEISTTCLLYTSPSPRD